MDEENDPLMASHTLSLGAKCVVASDSHAVLMCRRTSLVCCLRSNIEFFPLPDGSLVEIIHRNLSLPSTNEHVVGVRVISSTTSLLIDHLGSIRSKYLRPYCNFLPGAVKMMSNRLKSPPAPVAVIPPPRPWWPSTTPPRSRSHWPSSFATLQLPAHALDDGNSDDLKSDHDDLEGVNPASSLFKSILKLHPGGKATSYDQFPQRIREGNLGLSGIINLIQDGIDREFPKEVIQKFATALDQRIPAFNVPVASLCSASSSRKEMTLRFDFGDSCPVGEMVLQSVGGWVIEGIKDIEGDRVPINKGKLRRRIPETRKLLIRKEVVLLLEDGGIHSVRHGDLLLKGIVNISIKMHSKRCPGRVDTDDRGRPIVIIGPDGQPLVRAGQYLLQTYDEWLIVSAMHRVVWIGINKYE